MTDILLSIGYLNKQKHLPVHQEAKNFQTVLQGFFFSGKGGSMFMTTTSHELHGHHF